MKELSFCIPIKNRFDQIKHTLKKNLADNYKHKESIEFIVMDFASNDNFQYWIIDNFKKELDLGYLTYFYTEELENWHMSIAKNTAHLYSAGKICVNLDCDNFTGENGGKYLIDLFTNSIEKIIIHQFGGKFGDGSCGRISLFKSDFEKLGGYNEDFEPAGFQDIDLLLRAAKSKLKVIKLSNSKFNRTIKNSKEDCIKLCGIQKKWREMNKTNRLISEFNLKSEKLIANSRIYGIRKNVYKYCKGKFIKAKHRGNFYNKINSLFDKGF